jgi:hypothetical protein
MPSSLQVVSPELPPVQCPSPGKPWSPGKENDDSVTIVTKVDPVAGAERQPGFPHAGANALVVPDVAPLESENPRLDLALDGPIESPEPPGDTDSACGQVLASRHDNLTRVSYMIIIVHPAASRDVLFR